VTTATALDWRTRALCRLNPDLWTTRSVAMVALAIHICRRHCPVRAECAQDAAETDRFHLVEVVCAGVSYGNNGLPTTRQTAASVCASCRTYPEGGAQ